MLTAKDIGGAMGMMPAFATDDAVDIRATQTIAVDNLAEGVDRIIKDGIDVISTTGTYGECYNLLWEEFQTITTAAVDTVKKRVPLFIGVTSPNSREVVRKMDFVKDTGADGVLLGVPYYETLPLPDAVRFFHDIADLFPTLNILIYHNPGNHKFTLPVGAFKELVKKPGIIGMKDSHRTTSQFLNLQRITQGRISVFVNQTQLLPYYSMGAAGCWSTEVWMGPWPILHLRNPGAARRERQGRRGHRRHHDREPGQARPRRGLQAARRVRGLLQGGTHPGAVPQLSGRPDRPRQEARSPLDGDERALPSAGGSRERP